MKPRVLQISRFTPAIEGALYEEFEVHPLWKEPDAGSFLREHGAEFKAAVTGSLAGAPNSLIEWLPNLRVICNYGVGYDRIDLDTVRTRNIAVSNTPDVLTDCVADFAFALLLGVARGVSASDRFVRGGQWRAGSSFPLTTRVARKRLGVLGLGRIGQGIAARGAGFSMDIRYHSRRPVVGTSYAYEPSPVALAEWADFLVVACAGGPATHHLVSAEVLRALGPAGFIVNISRGTVVDEDALVAALLQKRIAGAGLDVFEHEPNVPAELLALENVVLAPHTASGTYETRMGMGELMLENLRSWYREGKLVTPVE
jgi:lactate dehydrogenase-like 2-hydroxyacid dehydrogenase